MSLGRSVHGMWSRPALCRAYASPGPCGAWVVTANPPPIAGRLRCVDVRYHGRNMRWPHGRQKIAARLVPFPDQGTGVVCTRTDSSRGDRMEARLR
jgi:hypothetical protein